MEPTNPPRPYAIPVLIGFLAVSLGVGFLGSLFSAPEISGWYASLAKPPLNPPNWIFAPVWTAIYILTAVATWIVWKTRLSDCRKTGLRIFWVQLGLNLLWSWTFFSRHQIFTAFVDLVVLWVAVLLMARSFRKMSIPAASLLVPYLLWVAFAGYLNFAIWRMN
ncbi:TspO/MBR family protein [Silvibacterium acidisoli]|uniref:TspO/MBR family protein n=1 Tax=Acidobacteriaceae bacterium ZG23-2 TaxID=2883246 RepID=UPI00406C1B63